MIISDPVDAAQADATSTIDRDGRLPPGMAILAIGVLSSLSWAVVVLVGLGLRAAL